MAQNHQQRLEELRAKIAEWSEKLNQLINELRAELEANTEDSTDDGDGSNPPGGPGTPP